MQGDEVDKIITTWQAARPELDFSALSVFSRLSRVAKHLAKIRAAAFESAGLESWEFDVLAVLRRAGTPQGVSIKVLVQETMVTSGTMTNRLDRLSQRQLVRRLPDPNDGRAALVQITTQGTARVDTAIAELLRAENAALKDLTTLERQRLASLLSKLGSGLKNS